jgi:hypothetical protein
MPINGRDFDIQHLRDWCSEANCNVLCLKLYQPSAHLTLYQKGTYYMGIRVFNSLPLYLKKQYNNCKCFKLALKDFLCNHSFFTADKFFDYYKNKDNILLK